MDGSGADPSYDPVGQPHRPPLPAPIAHGRIVAIARRLPPDALVPLAEALLAGGIGVLEVTMDAPEAARALGRLMGRYPAHEFLVGAGTVLDWSAAQAALDAGAGFLVTPHADPDLVARISEAGVPVIPGAFTPTEALRVWRAGAAAVKVFPASVLGPAFVREMRGPLPQIPLIPTGGVTAETAADFLAAGAVAVGVGSWLTGSGQDRLVTERARQLVAAVARVAPPAR
jgi:2-dehydro-3-deoxyphosphogluconate aldolase/(4S)-4-hydroxy-2-oxoglutarate aldolase